MEEKASPQVEETQVTTDAGLEVPPQPTEPTAELTPGAEQEPQERQYTQKEWSEREAAKDREIAGIRRVLVQQALRAESERRAGEEAQAQAQVRQAVDAGEITESEARERLQGRQRELQHEQYLRQQMAAVQGMQAQGEQLGRVLAAQDFAKRYEVDAEVLIRDKSLTTPHSMEAKAAQLALEKVRAELKAVRQPAETFDSGQVGSAGASIDSMSPEEKIRWGLDHPLRQRK